MVFLEMFEYNRSLSSKVLPAVWFVSFSPFILTAMFPVDGRACCRGLWLLSIESTMPSTIFWIKCKLHCCL